MSSVMGEATRRAGWLAAILVTLTACGVEPPTRSSTELDGTPRERPGAISAEIVRGTDGRDDLARDAIGSHGAVAAAHPAASRIGIDVLEAGGNAVDAAVATAFAISLLEPHASGIGGGGYLVVTLPSGDAAAIDFRETAPSGASFEVFEQYLREGSEDTDNSYGTGAQSAAVPGEVAGLLSALEQWGTWTQAQVVEPTITLAEQGIEVTAAFRRQLEKNEWRLSQFEASRELYFDADGELLEEGDTWCNPDYAQLLRRIAAEGADGFYRGPVADAIIAASSAADGILTHVDLTSYRARTSAALTASYHDYELVSGPPTSTGVLVLELLRILENAKLSELDFDSPERWHWWAEAMKLVFADKANHLGDPDFEPCRAEDLLTRRHLARQAQRIDPERAAEEVSATPLEADVDGNTTAIVAADQAGMAVAITKSLNWYFGSAVTVDGYGFVLNNHMRSFSWLPDRMNTMKPGKRPVSSMAPTIVRRNGQLVLAVSSPGSSRILPAITQVISNVLDHGCDVMTAIQLPRSFCQPGRDFRAEDRMSRRTQRWLRKLGHDLDLEEEFSAGYGGVQAIHRLPDGRLHAASDPRRGGQGAAY